MIEIFKGRDDAYGAGDGLCVKELVTDDVIKAHLIGKQRIGRYPLSPDIMNGTGTWWAVVDIDKNDLDLAIRFSGALEHIEIPCYIERSKSKGYHPWVFFTEPVEATKARALMQYGIAVVERDTGYEIKEVFPKQDHVSTDGYGNYMNLPLFGTDVKNGRTVFLDAEDGYNPYSDQWKSLASIEKVSPKLIDELIEIGELELELQTETEPEKDKKDNWVAPALKGVSEGERNNTATRLAGYFHSQHVAANIILEQLRLWNEKNDPPLNDNELETIVNSVSRYKTKKVHWVSEDTQPLDDERDFTPSLEVELPILPEECWRTGFADYRKALRRSTEACDEYHFGIYLTVVGLIIGRHSAIRYGRELYPNFYICCVGDTGESRKTSAADFGLDMLRKVGDTEIRIARDLSTPEGLLHFMANKDNLDEDNHPISFRTLAFHNELASLMKKAARTHASGLIQRLTTLYDCPPTAENPTVVDPLTVVRPFLSMIGLSTAAWLEDSLTERDIMGGFANRFLYFTGNIKEGIAFPDPPEPEAWNNAKSTLIELLESTMSEGVLVELDDQAHDLWKEYYENDWRKRTYENETIRALVQRIPDNIMKTALVYARLERKEKIDWKMLDAAIKVGEFCTQSVKAIFRLYGANEYAMTEAKVIDALKKLSGTATRTQIHHNVSGQLSATVLQKNLEALHAVGRIRLWTDEFQDKMGRTRKKQMATLLKWD